MVLESIKRRGKSSVKRRSVPGSCSETLRDILPNKTWWGNVLQWGVYQWNRDSS